MKVYFALGSGSRAHTDILTDLGASNRLSSYWYIRGRKPAELREFVETGSYPSRKKKPKAVEESGNK